MSSRYTRLMAVLAVAALCLSPIVTATAALAADQSPDVGYARNGGVVTAAGADVGFARNGGVVVPEPAPRVPARADRGVDAETVVLATLTFVVIVGAGVVSFLVSWRRHHHLAHPA